MSCAQKQRCLGYNAYNDHKNGPNDQNLTILPFLVSNAFLLHRQAYQSLISLRKAPWCPIKSVKACITIIPNARPQADILEWLLLLASSGSSNKSRILYMSSGSSSRRICIVHISALPRYPAKIHACDLDNVCWTSSHIK